MYVCTTCSVCYTCSVYVMFVVHVVNIVYKIVIHVVYDVVHVVYVVNVVHVVYVLSLSPDHRMVIILAMPASSLRLHSTLVNNICACSCWLNVFSANQFIFERAVHVLVT